MRRTGILLLVASVVLAIGSLAGGLVRAAQPAGDERFRGARPVDTPSPSFFIYLPLVTRNAPPNPIWVTVVEEGFESTPGDLWKFYDANQPQDGQYYWAPRDCRPFTGNYSAWAFGGGTSGAGLGCYSDYPANVDSRMEYGPFSLLDASAADLRFRFWLYRGDAYDRDEFCWSAGSSSAELVNNELCLTVDSGAWSPMTLGLGDSNGINLLGRPQVWIAFRFTSYGTGSQAEGAYVDDVVVRKCVGGTCSPAVNAVSAPTGALSEQSLASAPAIRFSKTYGSGR
jgi:hypothetical protein